MAEGFELYHIPQQSRRHKLRVGDLQGLRYDGEEFHRSAVSVLMGSMFLKPAQELLDGICDVGFGDKFEVACGLMMDPNLVHHYSSTSGVDIAKRLRLISLLDQVKKYSKVLREV
ncbi:hypothetical protein L1987_63831 [Smallanthus sonchifolius]|uniref:Uncharacterized protein n=1 Tax=Smallanthus sonchifolius TaxID=185202 RepID=A0ACB9CEC2_9ASTR|nr:hypothetical protein L1987_63831 [Smallanthus sonchifolius]